jgi:hypothetical protein
MKAFLTNPVTGVLSVFPLLLLLVARLLATAFRPPPPVSRTVLTLTGILLTVFALVVLLRFVELSF